MVQMAEEAKEEGMEHRLTGEIEELLSMEQE